MSDIADSIDISVPETAYDAAQDEPERFDRPYDEVFMPDGSLVEHVSVLDD